MAETEAAHAAAAQRLETAEESLRQAEQEHHRSAARADALAKALDEARGAAGAELLAGVTGVVGTLLDLVEVDSGWEDAFEAAAGASLAAVVVSGSDSARAALSRLRQGEATGAVLALHTAVGGSGSGAALADAAIGASPVPGEPVRAHVRGRRGRDVAGLDRLLDTLLANAVCPLGGWTGAIDLALDRPDLVVVTREGDRFSASGWRVRAGGGVVTAAVVDEARERAERAQVEAERAVEERRLARVAVDETRAAAAEAVRSDDRNEGAHLSARNALGRVTNERSGMTAEIEETSRQYTELDERIERDAARLVDLQDEIPVLDAARVAAADQAEADRSDRVRIDERIAATAVRRKAWEVRAAGLVERRRVLSDRLMEVERRLTGHADEREQAAERRRRLEADAVAVERLLGVVSGAQLELDGALGELRDRHRLQLEAVRAGERDSRRCAGSGRRPSTSWPPIGVACRRSSWSWPRRRSVGMPWWSPSTVSWVATPTRPCPRLSPSCPRGWTRPPGWPSSRRSWPSWVRSTHWPSKSSLSWVNATSSSRPRSKTSERLGGSSSRSSGPSTRRSWSCSTRPSPTSGSTSPTWSTRCSPAAPGACP